MLKILKWLQLLSRDNNGDCTTSHDALQSRGGYNSPPNSSWFLQTPEELQRQLIGQEHGGAHGKPSDGVDRRSAEENLHGRIKKNLSNSWNATVWEMPWKSSSCFELGLTKNIIITLRFNITYGKVSRQQWHIYCQWQNNYNNDIFKKIFFLFSK